MTGESPLRCGIYWIEFHANSRRSENGALEYFPDHFYTCNWNWLNDMSCTPSVELLCFRVVVVCGFLLGCCYLICCKFVCNLLCAWYNLD